MAIATAQDAVTQYLANLGWQNDATKNKANAALDAIRALLILRPESMDDAGTKINYASLEAEKTQLEKFTSTVPRANGRSRRVGVSYREGSVS